ncbi:hypothetical protein [uncultured Bacteroides sp.]|uniref:hypothetical protein n=1 Tax=uncultured Bacteroides sp. TaxID=162156 RepID=UPI0025EE495E|nr:hypothetical protein [uncultured Bacteroides sp.]
MNKRFGVVLGSIVAFIFLFFFGVTFPLKEEKLYYIPQAEMYLKTIKRSWHDYDYVVFGKDSLCTLSEEFDYIQFRKSDLPLDIYLIKGNKIILMPKVRGISTINSVQFEFIKTKTVYLDSLMIRTKDGPIVSILNFPHISISIDGFLRSVFVSDNTDKFVRLSPIN